MKNPTYHISTTGETFSLSVSYVPQAPGFAAPLQTTIATALISNRKAYQEACRLAALANIAASLSAAIGQAEEVLNAASPESFFPQH